MIILLCSLAAVAVVLWAVGIPARQVYTPRWAHTDDNHAWVEAWVDGEWHYLGASEPAPVPVSYTHLCMHGDWLNNT